MTAPLEKTVWMTVDIITVATSSTTNRLYINVQLYLMVMIEVRLTGDDGDDESDSKRCGGE